MNVPPAAPRRQRGQAIVELMVALPVLLLLLLGLVAVGQLLLTNYTVSQAARAAAHQAAIAGGAAEAAYSAAESVIASGVGTDFARATVRVSCEREPCRRYDPITVDVAYRGGFWAPLPPLFNEFSVRATATRAAERDQQ
jgi:Flp pilus assembly protein TadG